MAYLLQMTLVCIAAVFGHNNHETYAASPIYLSKTDAVNSLLGASAEDVSQGMKNREHLSALFLRSVDVDDDEDVESALMKALEKNKKQAAEASKMKNTVGAAFKDGINTTPLLKAVSGGNVEGVRVLLQNGAKLEGRDRHGETALMKASAAGNFPLVKLLIKAGAFVKAMDYLGRSSIMLSASNGHYAIVKALLNARAEVNSIYENVDGGNALTYASANGHLGVIHLLLDAGAKLEAKDKLGDTALLKASSKGRLEVIADLLSRGANPTAKNLQGENMLLKAQAGGHTVLVEMLKNAELATFLQ